MQDEENIQLLNLCIDESGTASIGITPHRFFLITAVTITPDQQELACLLNAKWRKKYLKNSQKSFHAADFFEDFKEDYRKPELKITKHFRNAVNELIDILDHVNFTAHVFYVDLPKLQKILGIENVPVYKRAQDLTTKKEKDEYRQKRREFEAYFKETHSGNKDKPFVLPILAAFKYHLETLEAQEKKDVYKRIFKGFISFESLSGADVKPIAAFHKYKDKIKEGVDYGNKIVGLNFPTKNSLDGGIEIADLISYVSCQTLRTSHKLTSELKNISEERIKLIKKARKFMRIELKIGLTDVTINLLPKTKKANRR